MISKSMRNRILSCYYIIYKLLFNVIHKRLNEILIIRKRTYIDGVDKTMKRLRPSNICKIGILHPSFI